jgi:hypothetical protein
VARHSPSFAHWQGYRFRFRGYTSAGGWPNQLLKIEPDHLTRVGSAQMIPSYEMKACGGPSNYAGLGGGLLYDMHRGG